MLRLPYKLLLAAPVLFLLYFYGLTRTGLIGPDEPRYAAIGREMARSGDWVTPRLWGERWFEKPALLYWLVAAGNKAGLGDDLAPRLPVALVSVGFLMLYFSRMRREFGERAAWYSSAILATAAGWIAYSHVAVTDLPLAAAFSTSLLLALPWVRSGGRRGLVAAGFFLGLAVLAKGLVPLVLIAPILWVGRERWRDLLIMAAACVAVAMPWYLACWLQNGDAFVTEFLWRHHFGRFLSGELQHVQPFWFYVPVLLGFLFPWTPLVFLLWKLPDWREPRRLLLVLTAGFGFVFFSASTNKLPGYVLPLLPSVSALLGIRLALQPAPKWLVPVCALLLCLVPVAGDTVPAALADGLSDSGILGFGSLAFWIALAVAGGVAALGLMGRASNAFAATAALAAASLLYLKWDMFPRLDDTVSARSVWSRMVRTGEPLCVDDLHRATRYGLNYYAGRQLPECSGIRERNYGILDRHRVIPGESKQ